jgi:hypothetical protein
MDRADGDTETGYTVAVKWWGSFSGCAYWEWEDARVFVAHIYEVREEERWRREGYFVSADEGVGATVDEDLYTFEFRITVRKKE